MNWQKKGIKGLEKLNTTKLVLHAIGDKHRAAMKHFSDALDNKSIILKNTSAQLRVSKASLRIKRNASRASVISKRALKSQQLIPTNAKEYQVDAGDARRTNQLWKFFICKIIESCSNELQLKTKLYEAGLLGAYVILLNKDNDHGRRVGGFVIHESKNCLFIALLPETSDTNRISRNKVVVKRIIKRCNVLAVSLPNVTGKTEDRVMILHGKNSLPLKNGSNFGS